MRQCGFAKTHHHTMFGDALDFLINTVFSLFGIALIIRAWIYAIRLHPFNPYSQAVLRVTSWLVQPLHHIVRPGHRVDRSEEHTSELQSLMRISYAVFCLKKKKRHQTHDTN